MASQKGQFSDGIAPLGGISASKTRYTWICRSRLLIPDVSAIFRLNFELFRVVVIFDKTFDTLKQVF
jgi:hypothetical protein